MRSFPILVAAHERLIEAGAIPALIALATSLLEAVTDEMEETGTRAGKSDPLSLVSLHKEYSTNCTRHWVAMCFFNLSTNAVSGQAMVEQGGAEMLVQLLVRASADRAGLEVKMAKRMALLNQMAVDRSHLTGHVSMAPPIVHAKKHLHSTHATHATHATHSSAHADEADNESTLWREELERTIAVEIQLDTLKRRVQSAAEKVLNSCAETMKLCAAAIGHLTEPRTAAHTSERSISRQEQGLDEAETIAIVDEGTPAAAESRVENSMLAAAKNGGGRTRAIQPMEESRVKGRVEGRVEGKVDTSGLVSDANGDASKDDLGLSLHAVYSRSIMALVDLLRKGQIQHAAQALFNLATEENAHTMLEMGVVAALTKLAVIEDESGLNTRARLKRKMEKQEKEKQETEKKAAEEAKAKEHESHTMERLFTHKQSEYWRQSQTEKVELREQLGAHEITKRNKRRRKDRQMNGGDANQRWQKGEGEGGGGEEEEEEEEDEDFIRLRGRAQCAAILCRLSSHDSLRLTVMSGVGTPAEANASVVRALIQCAQSNRQDLLAVHHCVSALCNFSCEVVLRQPLVDNGVVPELVRLSGCYNEQIRQGCAALFCNLTCDPRCHKAMVDQGTVPALVIMGLVASNSHLTRSLCCRAIFNLLQVEQPLLDKVLQQDGVRGISELCYHTFTHPPPPHIRHETEHICAVSLCNVILQTHGQKYVMKTTPIKVLLQVAEMTKVLGTQEVAYTHCTQRHLRDLATHSHFIHALTFYTSCRWQSKLFTTCLSVPRTALGLSKPA
jgi:hypothetical protein